MRAGDLRHRVDIESPTNVQDSETGAMTQTWETLYTDVPAAIKPLSVRGFIAAQQMQTEASTSIVIRYIPGLNARMRIRHEGTLYNIVGLLTDADSNRDYITIPCKSGLNDGE